MDRFLVDGPDSPQTSLPFRIITSKATIFTVPLELVLNLRGLVVSDQAFGKTLHRTQSIPKCFEKLARIISQESVNCVFVLGDLIYIESDEVRNNVTLRQVVQAFEAIPLQIFILVSEGNRPLLSASQVRRVGSNVTFVYDSMIRIHHPNPPHQSPPNVFLAHALEEVEMGVAEPLVLQLKRAFASDIAVEDFFVLGHTNQYVFDEQHRCATMKSLYADLARTAYAIVAADQDGLKIRVIGK
jgi:hypothetical protein